MTVVYYSLTYKKKHELFEMKKIIKIIILEDTKQKHILNGSKIIKNEIIKCKKIIFEKSLTRCKKKEDKDSRFHNLFNFLRKLSKLYQNLLSK